MMWVLVGLSSIELVIIHLLVAAWWPRVAVVLSLLSAGGIVWLVAAIRAMKRRPVTIVDGVIEMRVGAIKSIEIPVATVTGLRSTWDRAALKDRSLLNLALIAYPNVVLDLDPPIAGRRRTIRAVAHRFDDPVAFTQVVEALRPRA